MKSLCFLLLGLIFYPNSYAQIYESENYLINGNDVKLNSRELDTCTFILPASCNTVTDTVFDLNTLENKCFKMNLPPLVSPAPTPVCSAGGFPHNMSWMAFQAGFGEYSIGIDINNCTGGDYNAQLGIYKIDNYDFGNLEEIFCISTCVTGNHNISSDLLIPGEIYFLWLDGCSGSVCDFSVKVSGNYLPILDNINDNVTLNIGGSIWGTEFRDSLKTPQDRGGARVKVLLKDFTSTIIDSTITNNNGDYLFTNIPGSFYIIELPNSNFIEGGPLYGLSPCPKLGNDIITDNDNNGYGSGSIKTKFLSLYYDSITTDTAITNTTFDFCFYADCNALNPLASNALKNISDTICDINILNIFCSTANKNIDSSNLPLKFCNESIQAYNTDWFAFTAGKGEYEIEIEIYECIGGLNGAQIIIRDEWTKEDVFCSGSDCKTGKINISNDVLIPGRKYYLIINGCEGSVCRYNVIIKGTFTQFNLSDEGVFPELPPYCINDTMTFYTNIDREVYKGSFSWNIYRLSDNSVVKVQTSESKLDYQFSEKGIHIVELESIVSTCSQGGFVPANKVILIEEGIQCGSLNVELLNVKKVTCNEPGYIITDIQSGQSPYQIYIDSVLQISEDTHYINFSGFHSLKVVDASGEESNNEFWIGGSKFESNHDLVVTFASTNFRRGLTSNASIDLVNKTCKAINAELVLELPNEVSIENSTPFPSSIAGNIFKWNYSDLLEDQKINLVLKTDAAAVLNSTIQVVISANPEDNDLNPQDNSKQYIYTIIGSYDPNDKQSYPFGECEEHYIFRDQIIDYTIRFQNTGTAAAKDVYIIDSLSSYLDLNTFELLSSSHDLIVERERDHTLKFNFPDIELPAIINDSIGSNGYITFTARIKSETPNNTIIKNRSSIYFDLNDPITTNEVYHTVVDEIPIHTEEKTYELCYGESVSINGTTIVADTTITSIVGCDSITSDIILFKDKVEVTIRTDGNQLSSDSTFTVYEWIDCDDESKIFISLENYFIPSYSGNFKLKVEKNGCIGISDCIDFLVGIDDNINSKSVVVYPNPFNETLIIESNVNEDLGYLIKDYSGRTLSIGKLVKSSSAISTSGLPKGIYTIEFKNRNFNQVVRGVKVE